MVPTPQAKPLAGSNNSWARALGNSHRDRRTASKPAKAASAAKTIANAHASPRHRHASVASNVSSLTVTSNPALLLRQQWGAIGLAIASAAAISGYVLLLGSLQYRRFQHEAAATGTTLKDIPGMLDGALRLSAAAAGAIGVDFAARALVLHLLPGMHLTEILLRGSALCAFGLAVYLVLDYLEYAKWSKWNATCGAGSLFRVWCPFLPMRWVDLEPTL